MKASWRLVPLILSVLLSGCGCSSHLSVVNGSDEAVKSMTIAIPGSHLEIRDLAVGQTRTWRYGPEHDSCFKVQARFISGATIEVPCVGYTTPNEGISHRLTLGRDGMIGYEVLN
jgi:hypothetical protein